METKLKLIELLERYNQGIHLREISRNLKTGLPNVIRYINLFEKEGVITKRKDANTIKISLKFGDKTLAYLKQVNTEKFLHLPKKIQFAITDFLNELENTPLVAIIFGSYAKNNYTSESDIDLLLIYQKVENEKSIENLSKKISMKNNVKLSPVYIDYKSFEKNFLNKKHDFSNEIRKNVIVLRGIEIYYPLVWRFFE